MIAQKPANGLLNRAELRAISVDSEVQGRKVPTEL